MSPLRSDRLPALLLLGAAGVGLALANSPAGPAAIAVRDAHPGWGGPFDLSTGHWISDGLLAVFFFVAAVELQFELTRGALNSARRALLPAIAAASGVVVPILLYLLVAGAGATAAGWPIPTATDIAFALGVLAVLGRGLPPALRAFLLALAILDDIVGIVLIAALFARDVDLWLLVAALVVVVAFGALSRTLDSRGRGRRPGRSARIAALVALALAAWALTEAAGIHPTIAGVALGLACAQHPAMRAKHALDPWVNGAVLPLFALSAALVVVPRVSSPSELSPAFWGIALALPVGKLVGITGAAWIGQRILGRGGRTPRLPIADLLAAGALGGIGFTVSLLMAELAFRGDGALRDQATLGVLAGSGVALVVAAMLVSWRAWHYRRTPMTEPA